MRCDEDISDNPQDERKINDTDKLLVADSVANFGRIDTDSGIAKNSRIRIRHHNQTLALGGCRNTRSALYFMVHEPI